MHDVLSSATPAGACDCHVHVYAEGYPFVASATVRPTNAALADYRVVQRALGLARVVLVQPNGYGFDNACLLAAMPALGDSARAIVTVPPDVADDELRRLSSLRACGVRFHLLPGGALGWESLAPMAERIAPHGWHVQLQLDGRELPRYANALARLPVPLVVDHVGKFLEPVPNDHPGVRALHALLDGGNTWVKLSAPYETSKTGPPRYEDVGAIARSLVRAHPERCVWASNWPHPGRDPRPDSAAMLNLLGAWTGDDAITRRVLVDNPSALYRF